MTRLWAAFGCTLLLLVAACGSTQTSQLLHPTRATGPLVNPSTLADDFVWRQRIEVRFRERRESFAAVIEKRADRLLLLGLTPFGTRAFALEQRGQKVTYTPYMQLTLPFSPLYILADVHRTFFRGLPRAPWSDGWHEGVIDHERIRERWQNGRLYQRTYQSLDRGGNAVAIEYAGGMQAHVPARTIVLTSQRFGYVLTITTLFASALPPAARATESARLQRATPWRGPARFARAAARSERRRGL